MSPNDQPMEDVANAQEDELVVELTEENSVEEVIPNADVRIEESKTEQASSDDEDVSVNDEADQDDSEEESSDLKFNDTPEAILPEESKGKLSNYSSPFYNTPDKASYPSDFPVNQATMDSFNKITDDIDDERFNPSIEWANEINTALTTVNVFGDGLDKASKREADWHQRIAYEGRQFGPATPKIATPKADNELLTGLAALMKVQALTGTGKRVTMPFWASGIWVSFRAPTIDSLVELERRIVESKSILGRTTHGFIFSNQAVYVDALLVDFALAHAFDSSVKGWTPDGLRRIMKQQDIQTLALAMAITIYPNGFNYAQPCMANPTNCQHVVRDMINPMKLLWTDNLRLSDAQRKFMAVSANTKQELAEIEKYQESFTSSVFVCKSYKNNAMRVVFKVPTILEHITGGMEWITNVEQRTEEAFGVNLRGEQRRDYLTKLAASSRAVIYAHWVKEIQVPDEETERTQIISNPEDVVAALIALSADVDLIDQFYNDVSEYINDSVISLIGVPNFACPSCKKWHTTAAGPISKIIPVDAVSVFFRLQQLRIERTTS